MTSFAYEATENNTKLAVVDVGYGDGILKARAKHEAMINGKRYPIRALMMSVLPHLVHLLLNPLLQTYDSSSKL